jgi:succinate dehydrogenase / fumarate reductase iron-sulfur subunit
MSQATFRIWRGDRSGGDFKDYAVEYGEGMVVLDCVHQIQATQAPDLACRWNCKAGKCGSCSAEVNGKPRLMCMTRMETVPTDQPIILQPMKAFPLIKDLVTDVSWNYRVNQRIPPFRPRPRDPDGNWRMAQEEVDRIQEFRKCIECFLCQNVCHVLRDHDLKQDFGGPRFMIRVASLDMHPLDTGNRLQMLKDDLNIGLCNITKCCTEVCPEHIHITDNGIIPLKERVVDEFYDPVMWLWRKIFGSKDRRVPLKALPVISPPKESDVPAGAPTPAGGVAATAS